MSCRRLSNGVALPLMTRVLILVLCSRCACSAYAAARVNASQAYASHLWPRGAYATAVGGAQSLANLSSAKLTPTEGKVRPDARVALMIEVRPLRAACNALASAVEALRPHEWRITFWHGDDDNACVEGPGNIDTRRLSSLFPKEHARAIRTASAPGWWARREWYNSVITSVRFWSIMERSSEHLMLFQADSVFCPNPSSPIASFLKYPFIGAPWDRRRQAKCLMLSHCVGNNGFALFRPRLIMRLLPLYNAQDRKGRIRNFDVWLMMNLQRWLPSERAAADFSVETIRFNMSNTPIGVHNPYPYLSRDSLEGLQTRCPRMRFLENGYSRPNKAG